jgi:heme-degrading monooxygenase HmoA
MPLISVTRFRSRSVLFLPLFALHANKSMGQARKADGLLSGAVQRQTDGSLWTMSVWRDERSMHAYVASGAHRSAMPHLRDWAVEASVVRWAADSPVLPTWHEAASRMREEGRSSKLRHPGPDHAARAYPEADPAGGMRL